MYPFVGTAARVLVWCFSAVARFMKQWAYHLILLGIVVYLVCLAFVEWREIPEWLTWLDLAVALAAFVTLSFIVYKNWSGTRVPASIPQAFSDLLIVSVLCVEVYFNVSRMKASSEGTRVEEMAVAVCLVTLLARVVKVYLHWKKDYCCLAPSTLSSRSRRTALLREYTETRAIGTNYEMKKKD